MLGVATVFNVEDVKEGAREGPVVRAPQVVAAGLASTLAAFLTSTFGVARTMLGAALAAMIITGGIGDPRVLPREPPPWRARAAGAPRSSG